MANGTNKDFEEASLLYRILKNIVIKIMAEMDFVRAINATVTAVNGNTITAYLAGDDVANVSDFENRTGQVIAVTDIVYIILPHNKLSNSFLGWVIK